MVSALAPSFASALRHSPLMPRNIGTRMQWGRPSDYVNAANGTFQDFMALAQDFDAVRIILANGLNTGGTTAEPNLLVAVAAPAAATLAAADAAAWTSGAFAGSLTTAFLKSDTLGQKRYTVSDWIKKSSIPRTDGGTLPLLAVRTYVIANANPITIRGLSSDNITNWLTHPTGRIWGTRRANGDRATTNQTTFEGVSSAISQSPVVGVQYRARGIVYTVMNCGDSNDEGHASATNIGAGFGFQACCDLSDKNRIAVEYANIGYAGSSMTNILGEATRAFAAGIAPDIFQFPAGTQNSVTTTITDANIAAIQQVVGDLWALGTVNRAVPICRTWMPVNAAVEDYGSSDSLRRAFNTKILEMRARGLLVVDVDAALRGSLDGDDHMQLNPAFTGDGAHANDAGIASTDPLYRATYQMITGLPLAA